VLESKQNKDLILSNNDARGLRDEIAKLLADRLEEGKDTKKEEIIKVEINGGKW
jgi:hypothetical protein